MAAKNTSVKSMTKTAKSSKVKEESIVASVDTLKPDKWEVAYEEKLAEVAEKSAVEKDSVAKPAKKKAVAKKVKKYDDTDLIFCKSIFSGEYFIVGSRSGILYSFANYGDEVGIEYRDLLYIVRSKDSAIFKPNIIIMDEEFVEQHRELTSLYSTLYNTRDLTSILISPVDEMVRHLEVLPKGCLDAARSLASSMIVSGEIDGMTKIKALDEIFDTNLVLLLEHH